MASTVDVDRLKEYEDGGDDLKKKVNTLITWMRESKYTVFYTGAGVSTSSGVSDYRGPTGAWTMQRLRQLETKLSGTSGLSADESSELKLLREEAEKKKKEAPKKVDMMEAQPSISHMAQSTLIRLGLAHYVITTNLDGIYRKAGLKAHTQLCCLHGDVYVERCTGCGRDFERNYHVRQPGVHVHDHTVPAPCPSCGSKNKDRRRVGTRDKNMGTKDTHINFGEYLDDADWNEADVHTKKADLCIVAGTSMSLRHITHFPFQAKRTVIINLQETPDDEKCDLRIFAKCDPIFQACCDALGVTLDPIPVWRPADSVPLKKIPPYVHQVYKESARRLDEMIAYREQEAKDRAAASGTPVAPGGPSTTVAATVTPTVTAEVKETKRVVSLPDELVIGNTHEAVTNDGGNEHKWAMFVSSNGDPHDVTCNGYIDRVIFDLHPTFTPPRQEVKVAPYLISRLGWGTFTVRVTVHFKAEFGTRDPLVVDHELNFSAPQTVSRHRITAAKPPRSLLGALSAAASTPSSLRPTETRVTDMYGRSHVEPARGKASASTPAAPAKK